MQNKVFGIIELEVAVFSERLSTSIISPLKMFEHNLNSLSAIF